MLAAHTQLDSVQVSTLLLAVASQSLLLTDAQLIIILTLQCTAQEICLVHSTKSIACLQDQCARVQSELRQCTANYCQHFAELTLQLENANKKLSTLQVSLCYLVVSSRLACCLCSAAQHCPAMCIELQVYAAASTSLCCHIDADLEYAPRFTVMLAFAGDKVSRVAWPTS